MIIVQTKRFIKAYGKLPLSVQRKADRQLRMLAENFFHPSLYAKKKDEDTWEFRIDYHYRMTGIKVDENLHLLTIGMHDTGLGKK